MSRLRSLRSLIAAWKPGGAPSAADDAGAIAAAWSDVVGPAVATRTRPGPLRNGVLTIWTAGSAWSAELSFLESSILAGLQSRVPNAGVTRVRFSVASGRTKLLLDGAVGRTPRAFAASIAAQDASIDGPDGVGDGQSERDPAHIVRRMRSRQLALDARRADEGWSRCSACAAWIPPSSTTESLCVRCAEEDRQNTDRILTRALADAPWQTPRDFIASTTGADRASYERVRRRMLASLEVQLDAARRRLRRGTLDAADRVAAWTYVMLIARKQKRALPRAVVADVLDDAWADALGFHPNTRRREARTLPWENAKSAQTRVDS